MMIQRPIMKYALACTFCVSLWSQPNGLAAEGPSDASGINSNKLTSGSTTINSSQADVATLKKQIDEQQARIEQLVRSLDQLKERLDLSLKAKEAEGETSKSPSQVSSLTPVVPSNSSAADPNAIRQSEKPKPSPLTIRVGDADLTVGGFMDFTAFFRTTNLGSGIGTSFGSAPFSNTMAGHLSETRFSTQNSRVSFKADSHVGTTKVTGYLESDFLGFQPTNGFVTSNSNSLRMRLYWVRLERGKFDVLAGQSWSLLTPGRSGISPNPSDIFYSQNMDTNYQVGLIWSRQAQFRVVYHPSNLWTLGLSVENPQQFATGSVVLPGASCTASPAGPFCSQLDVAGTGGATSTPNLRPDLIGKVTYDPHLGGKQLHFEVAGLLRSFKVFNPALGTSKSIEGGGASVNINLEVAKNLHIIWNNFYSDGGGRYIFGLGPDLIVRPDGTPSAVHSGSSLGGFEYQVNRQLMLYSYYGGAYYQRNFNLAIDPKTGKISYVGFGFPGSSNSSNRTIQEGTFGFIQTFWKNPRFGALQWINQYSYLSRSPWSVPSGSPQDAHLSMVYTDLRYVLP